MTPKGGKNRKVAHLALPSVPLMFLSHSDFFWDLLKLNQRIKSEKSLMVTSYVHLSSNRS